ncbi:hypothetical protein NQ318_001137 [Aromia moschata]|uniref:Ribosomal protein S4 n=1 Tax=Aromia moschata TaxID=1265417 RepID=A0AAV8ZEP9_9CUCU|nr:hypothetical protein NQ318_001137 [Aromia moschata]
MNIYPEHTFLNGLKRDVKRPKMILAPNGPQRQKLTKTLKKLINHFGVQRHMKRKCSTLIIILCFGSYCLKIYQLAYNLLSFYKICKPKTHIFLIRFCLPMMRHLLYGGVFNCRNNHLWDSENLHAVKERHFQHEFKVNISCGVISNFVTGPFELPPNLTGPRYLNFPQHNLNELLKDVPLALRENMHDGVPPHVALPVRQYLHEHFPHRWIGRGST